MSGQVSTPSPTRFLVLGAGAIGGYFGGKLAQGGLDVEFLVRPKRAKQLAMHGLMLKTHEGDTRTFVTTRLAGQVEPKYDCVLLCCKAYDLDAAIEAIAPAIGPKTAILPFLNGVKHLEVLGNRFPGHVLGGLTAVNAALGYNGAIVQSSIKVSMTAFGELDGIRSDRCTAIERAFTAAGITEAHSSTVLASMWTKFAAFCAIATIVTLCRSRAGGIATASASGAFVAAALDECCRIVAAHGYTVPAGMREIVTSLFTVRESSYGPSILFDMERGRRTEVEHTIGDMVDKARLGGIAAPLSLAALCNLQVYERSEKNRIPADRDFRTYV